MRLGYFISCTFCGLDVLAFRVYDGNLLHCFGGLDGGSEDDSSSEEDSSSSEDDSSSRCDSSDEEDSDEEVYIREEDVNDDEA